MLCSIIGNSQDVDADSCRVHVEKFLSYNWNVSTYALLCLHWSTCVWYGKIWRAPQQVCIALCVACRLCSTVCIHYDISSWRYIIYFKDLYYASSYLSCWCNKNEGAFLPNFWSLNTGYKVREGSRTQSIFTWPLTIVFPSGHSDAGIC